MRFWYMFACLLWFTGQSNGQNSLPNIVILYADDMGYGDLAVQNPDSKIPTPHLDELARQGTRFTDAHSSSGVCTPSRYALLQGRYHWRKFHGIVNSFDQPILDDDKTTLAELLKTRGYQTACIGKWHLGWDWNSIKKPGATPKSSADGKPQFAPEDFDWTKSIAGGPLSHGFDYYFGDDVPNFPPYAWFENDRIITPPTVPLTTPKKTAEGSWEARPGPAVENWDFWDVMPQLTRKAVQWIEKQNADTPFFLYFPFTSPHAPIVPTLDFQGKSKANGFGDFMVQTDDTVGRVIEALERKGFSKNTIVIFSSDNGPETYAYDRLRNFNHRSMGPLRGLKRDLWEGGHRVPMVVKWPGKVPANRVCDGLMSQIDLYATVAKIVNATIPPGSAEDSYDQMELWLNRSSSARKVLVHNTNANGYAIRSDDWVLIQAKSGGGISKVPDWFNQENRYLSNESSGALYNLRDDLAQRNNLIDQNQDRAKKMTLQLEDLKLQSQVR